MLSIKNKHELDERIRFQDEGHIYWIDNNSDGLISVTTLIHKYFGEFNAQEQVNRILKSDKYTNDSTYEYYGMSKDEILKKWSGSSILGTKMHADIEKFYNNEYVCNDTIEYGYFKNFYNDFKHWTIYRTEWLVFSEKHRLTGSIDAVFINPDDTLTICDWKRVKRIDCNVTWNNVKYGKHPLSDMPDTNYSHYCLQLNTYRYILENFYEKKIKDMYLIVLHPNNDRYIKIEVPFLHIINDLMNIRMNSITKISMKDIKDITYNDLSEQQKLAYKYMVNGKNIFLTAGGGMGKSAIINMFYKEYKNTKEIGITSTTGTSALLIGGSTLHSFLGIGLATGTVEQLYIDITKNKPRKIVNRWKSLNILIIDEISMLRPDLFDKIETLARSIRKSNKPFGGIQLILSGDFFQLPCIGSDKLCFEAEKWSECVDHVVYLKRSYRQNDIDFQQCLHEIRIGEISDKSLNLLKSRINADLSNEFGIIPTKIYALNKDVDMINEQQLNMLASKNTDLEFYEYELEYKLHSKSVKNPNDKIDKACMAPRTLQICKGVQVMLIFNVDVEAGLVNGSRGVVVDFIDGYPIVQFMNGHKCKVDYVEWNIEENNEKLITVTQIPLKIAYACTVHKVQGQTLDLVEIDMKRIFEYGMCYVALSRVCSLESLSIRNFSKDKILVYPKVVDFYKRYL